MNIKNKIFTKTNGIIVGLILLSLLTRLIGVNRSIWNDEQISLNTLSINPFLNPFYFGVTTNLPLYFYLLKIYTLNGFITNIIYIRFLGIILNTLSIYIVYKYFKFKKFKHLNLIAAYIMAISPIQIHYAQEIRPYALTQLLILIHLLLCLNFNKNVFSKKLYLVSGLIFLSHFAGFIYLFCINIFLVIGNIKKLSIKKIAYFISTFLIAAIIMVISYKNPNFINSYTQISNNTKFGLSSITEGIIKLKEVITFYYFYGLWYYMVSPIIQEFFKKIVFSVFLSSLLIITIKKQKKLFKILTLFFIILFFSYFLDVVNLYPFGGRHIMPFSFIEYIIISVFFTYIYNLKYIVNKIIVILVLGLLLTLFSFHTYCTNNILLKTNLVGLTNSNTYQFCINKFQTPK